jgi:hypothetical protein
MLFLLSLLMQATASGEAEQILDNGKLIVTAKPGSPIVAMTRGEAGKATRVELVLCGQGETPVSVTKVEPRSPETMRVYCAGAGVDISLGEKQVFLTVVPITSGSGLEVRSRSCYAVLPDFFGYDVVYYPAHCKSHTLLVPAENFLLNFPEGNRAIVMCVWQGRLSNPDKERSAGVKLESDGREPSVRLLFEGEGSSRRVVASRIELLGPVHVAILEHENLWYDQDVSNFKPLEPIKLEWRRPFDAHWRLDTLVAEGKKVPDLISRTQSYRFLYAPDEKKRKERPPPTADIEDRRAWEDSMKIWEKGYPVVYEERLYSHIYSAWFNGDDTYIALFDNPKKPTRENVYERILIYPLERDPASPRQTPLEVHTIVDVMRETLGQEPCAYILELEGIYGRGRGRRGAGGEQKIMNDATCTIWRDIFGMMGGKTPKELPPEKKARLIQGFKDMLIFLHAVAERIEEYRQFNERLLKFVAEQKDKAGTTAQRIGAIAEAMKNMFENYEKRYKLKDTLAYWDKTVPEYIAMFEAGNYDNWAKGSGMRELGQNQDNLVSDCRRYVKAIRHEASFAESDRDEVQKFMYEVREMCQQIMRNPHPKELTHTDPNSPRLGLPVDKR